MAHELTWELSGGLVGVHARCTEGFGADCRLVGGPECACEEWEGPLRDEQGPYHRVQDDEGEEHKHRMHDGGSCHFVDAMDAYEDEALESGPAGVLQLGVTKVVPTFDGIEYGWEIDDE